MSLRDLTRWIWDNTYPFWTCHPSGNLVDGLPLAIHKNAVLASCRFPRRAPIRIPRCKIIDDADTYREIVPGNSRDSVLPHIDDSMLASERSKRLDHRRILSVSIFRKCWIFLVENLKFLKSLQIQLASICKIPQQHNAYPRTFEMNMNQFNLAETVLYF